MCSVRSTKYGGTEYGMHGGMQFSYTTPVLKPPLLQGQGQNAWEFDY